jgi:hypothetical protein
MDLSAPFDTASEQTTSSQAEQTSQPFVGRWRQLVSTTNWEKGRIIAQWRDALIEAGAEVNEYSDDSWSRRVGGVTPQHVGRLRRVYHRFGLGYEKYPNLYWTHFQAAIDWNDAEMWLEGAVQNAWSVSDMRSMRWQTMGSIEAQRPIESEIISVETDEDFDLAGEQPTRNAELDGLANESTAETIPAGMADSGNLDFSSGPVAQNDSSTLDESSVREEESGDGVEPVSPVRPFADLPSLPTDLADAVESFKLAILRHKASQWSHVSPDNVLASLDALKCLVTAPSEAT